MINRGFCHMMLEIVDISITDLHELLNVGEYV